MKADILVICTGNSSRSQMAEYFLRSFDSELNVVSAGTEPAKEVNTRVIKVMKELGIDLSKAKPNNIGCCLNNSFDYVVTVCDHAQETCPTFLGIVRNRLHISFEDPTKFTGTEDEVMNKYRNLRDQIKEEFEAFYLKIKKDFND